LRAGANGWEVKLDHRFRQPPRRLVVRVPWFYELQAAAADGRPLDAAGGRLVVGPDTREIKVQGRIRPGTPETSYAAAVEQYKREYRKRYEDFLRTGTIQPENKQAIR
jgi:hypothetical protein